MNINKKHWWNDTDSGKQKYVVKNLSQCHFNLIHHNSHMDWPGIEHGPSAVRGQ
jgi:hypothetical protein